jgi:hypothetical protein
MAKFKLSSASLRMSEDCFILCSWSLLSLIEVSMSLETCLARF